MTYRVIIQPRALEHLEAQYQYIAQQSPWAAASWFNRFVKALESLAEFPQRCPVARESDVVGREVRQLLFGGRAGTRSAYFVIEADTVRILAIRHSTRSDIPLDDLLND